MWQYVTATSPIGQWVENNHDDVIKWKHFPRYWPFVRRIHRSPVNSPHKGQWRGALMFSLICARINGWVNNSEAGDLRRYHAHCDVIVMMIWMPTDWCQKDRTPVPQLWGIQQGLPSETIALKVYCKPSLNTHNKQNRSGIQYLLWYR